MIELVIEGTDAAARRARFAEGLSEAEWILDGHFIADITMDAATTTKEGETVTLSALSIEDW